MLLESRPRIPALAGCILLVISIITAVQSLAQQQPIGPATQYRLAAEDPFLCAAKLDQRSQRPDLPEWSIPSFLSDKSLWRSMGPHELGSRHVDRPRPLEASAHLPSLKKTALPSSAVQPLRITTIPAVFVAMPDKKTPGCLIAIYTGASPGKQTQNIAVSRDEGATWTKYSGNPVIDLGLKNFRDPKVFWHEASKSWVMVVALPDQHKLRFYRSPNLRHWELASEFGPAGAVSGVWECPDLFELPVYDVQGNLDGSRWLLNVNINPGGPAGGSGDQYFVGKFDGTTFTEDHPGSGPHWVDWGKDFYASTSFANTGNETLDRTWIAWMSNWQYASKLPSLPGRGEMTTARQLVFSGTACLSAAHSNRRSRCCWCRNPCSVCRRIKDTWPCSARLHFRQLRKRMNASPQRNFQEASSGCASRLIRATRRKQELDSAATSNRSKPSRE